MKKSVTAPCTFGVDDPLWDRLSSIYQTGDKAEKQHAKDYVTRSTEYWAPVVVRGDEGTAETPNVRIFRLPEDNTHRRMTLERRIALRPEGDNPLYVRITQEDGHLAWSSPIYVYR